MSFEVAQEAILDIAGPNGSGKSTLFNLISRIPFGASSGKVTLEQTLGVPGREAERLADEASERVGFPRDVHNMPAASMPVFYQKQLMMATAVGQKPES